MLHSASTLVLLLVLAAATTTTTTPGGGVWAAPVPGEAVVGPSHLSTSEKVEHFVVGGVDSVGDTAKGILHAGLHPIDSTFGMLRAMSNPIGTGRAIREQVKQAYAEDPARAAGYTAATALQLVLPFYSEVTPARHAMVDGSAAAAQFTHDHTIGLARKWSATRAEQAAAARVAHLEREVTEGNKLIAKAEQDVTMANEYGPMDSAAQEARKVKLEEDKAATLKKVNAARESGEAAKKVELALKQAHEAEEALRSATAGLKRARRDLNQAYEVVAEEAERVRRVARAKGETIGADVQVKDLAPEQLKAVEEAKATLELRDKDWSSAENQVKSAQAKLAKAKEAAGMKPSAWTGYRERMGQAASTVGGAMRAPLRLAHTGVRKAAGMAGDAFSSATTATINAVPGLRKYVVQPATDAFHAVDPVVRASLLSASVPVLQRNGAQME